MESTRGSFLRQAGAIGVAGAAAVALPALSSHEALAATGSATPTVVLVHGAWANASSWNRVIPLLASANLSVTAAHLSLRSLSDDAATVARAVEDQPGPVLLVGHSYGGMAMTQGGTSPKVAGLVYVAAFAPSEGDSVFGLAMPYPPAPADAELRPDTSGYLFLTPRGIAQDFAQDLPADETAVLTVTQAPTFNECFSSKATAAAWKGKPTWFVIAENDRVIPPELHAASAKKIGAQTTRLRACHVAMLARPKEVAAVIISAAKALS